MLHSYLRSIKSTFVYALVNSGNPCKLHLTVGLYPDLCGCVRACTLVCVLISGIVEEYDVIMDLIGTSDKVLIL